VCAPCAGAATLEGRVIAVATGDTFTMIDANEQRHEVRLLGAAAPELDQPYGDKARDNLALALMNQKVRVEWTGRDATGVIRGKVTALAVPITSPLSCHLPPPCVVDIAMAENEIVMGYAWYNPGDADELSPLDRERYADTERAIRKNKRRMWADPNPIPPWEWRKGTRAAAGGSGALAQ
jgi:endonuclease YncB( thermonuclease family)